MAHADRELLLMLSAAHAEDAWRFDLLDRRNLTLLGHCALHCTTAHDECPRCYHLTIDAPESLKPAVRRAVLRWHDRSLRQRALVTLDDGSVTDTGAPSPGAEALLQTGCRPSSQKRRPCAAPGSTGSARRSGRRSTHGRRPSQDASPRS